MVGSWSSVEAISQLEDLVHLIIVIAYLLLMLIGWLEAASTGQKISK